MASGRVRVRQDRRQDAVRTMGSLASGWRQVASGCVRMASRKRENSIRMASGSVRVASRWRQDGVTMASGMVHICARKRQGGVMMAVGRR